VKILFLSTFEKAGGAARSAHRLYLQLNKLGLDCRMLVQYKQSTDQSVSGPESWLTKKIGMLRPYLDGLPLLLYRSRLSPPWSLAWLPNSVSSVVQSFSPDIIHLHGIGHGFLSLASIVRLSKPLVWTLHDSWAFTGGCHLPGNCTRYINSCGRCPQLKMRHESDLSRWGWQRKASYWSKLDLTFIAPSQWIADCAQASSLLNSFPIDFIPNGIDNNHFSPAARRDARDTLNLPQDAIVILYGASSFMRDENKGFAYLESALTALDSNISKKKLMLLLFGDNHFPKHELAGIPVRSLGLIASENLLLSVYRAADLFVLPSLQENLPNTLMEAMACGVPCVAFEVGGVGDLIKHKGNGFLVKAADAGALARGINWMLADGDRRTELSRQSRRTIETNFAIDRIAELHMAEYEKILSR